MVKAHLDGCLGDELDLLLEVEGVEFLAADVDDGTDDEVETELRVEDRVSLFGVLGDDAILFVECKPLGQLSVVEQPAHRYPDTHRHAQTHVHTEAYTYTHTHIHTHIHMNSK
jgi:hypothetical protein